MESRIHMLIKSKLVTTPGGQTKWIGSVEETFNFEPSLEVSLPTFGYLSVENVSENHQGAPIGTAEIRYKLIRATPDSATYLIYLGYLES